MLIIFTSAAVGCKVIATEIRPDLGPFWDGPSWEKKPEPGNAPEPGSDFM